jgi:hypothetical protein
VPDLIALFAAQLFATASASGREVCFCCLQGPPVPSGLHANISCRSPAELCCDLQAAALIPAALQGQLEVHELCLSHVVLTFGNDVCFRVSGELFQANRRLLESCTVITRNTRPFVSWHASLAHHNIGLLCHMHQILRHPHGQPTTCCYGGPAASRCRCHTPRSKVQSLPFSQTKTTAAAAA